MQRLSDLQHRFFKHFLDQRQNVFAVSFFCKALVAFTIVKILVSWTVSTNIVSFYKFSPSPSLIARILFFPAFWASTHIVAFYLIGLVFLAAFLFVRWNYVVGSIFFWFTLNLFRSNLPIANGADYVLFMLAFWTIGMTMSPVTKNKNWSMAVILCFNVSVLLCQLQIVFIYFVSGWDKLMSDTWRSGEAMSYVSQIDYLFNSHWFGLLDNRYLNIIISWITILFELAFIVLVWIKQTRLIILTLGVVFHLAIWLMLSLPDFGLIMMVSYLIFLRDSDYVRFRKILKLKPL